MCWNIELLRTIRGTTARRKLRAEQSIRRHRANSLVTILERDDKTHRFWYGISKKQNVIEQRETKMKSMNRRRFVTASAGACLFPAAVQAAELNSRRREKIDQMANSSIYYMIQQFPDTQDLIENAPGLLMVPVMTRGALLIGGAVGDGVLRVHGETVAYYSALQLNVGLQLSAQQYSQAVFFLNEDALRRFRASQGWKFGAGMRYAVVSDVQGLSMDSLTSQVDVAGLTFGESGLHIGATVEGTKFAILSD